MITDLGAAVDLFVTDLATIQRPAPDTYDANGRAAPRVFTTSTARVCVQPITGFELRRLAPGTDTVGLVSLWSKSRLQVGDIVTLPTSSPGEYEVEQVDDWSTLASYHTGVARRRAPDEARP
jgi:hypothetical protein